MIYKILMTLKCAIFGGCFHEWGPWGMPVNFYQRRYCKKCNKVHERTI